MFLVENSAKNDKFGYLNTIFGKLGVMHDLGWWLVGKPVVDFLFALIEIFSLSITVPELWGEMCTVQLFSQGGRPLCTQILPGQGRPSSAILDIRKLETLWYPMVKTASLFLCVPSFWHNTEVWRTDRRANGFAVAYTVLAKLGLRSAVKSEQTFSSGPESKTNFCCCRCTTEVKYSYIPVENSAQFCQIPAGIPRRLLNYFYLQGKAATLASIPQDSRGRFRCIPVIPSLIAPCKSLCTSRECH